MVLARTMSSGRHRHPARRARAALDLVEQQVEAQAPHLEEVLAHRRQRRREVRGLGHVVEPRHRDVARDRATRLVQRPEEPERHLVVGDEDGGHVGVRRELLAERVAGGGAPVAGQAAGRLDPGPTQRALPSDDALLRLVPVLRAADVPDVPVTPLEEVPGHGDRSGDLIDGDKRHSALRPTLGGHDRDVLRELQDGVRGLVLRGDHEDSLHALDPKALERLEHRGPVERLEAHRADEVARLVRGAVDPEQRRRGTVERRVDPDDAEGLGPPRREGACHRVRAVVEHPHRFQDGRSGVGPGPARSR